MYRPLKVLVSCGALLVAGCGDSSRISSELQNDLALASAGADLELASRPTDQTRIVGAVERTTPPSRVIASSARAPRPRRSPTPRVVADVQQEIEIVQEPEIAVVAEPAPAPVEEVPVEIAESPRHGEGGRTSAGGPDNRGSVWGTVISIGGGTVVIRGGGVGEDRCIPPGAGRGRPIAINDRFPPRGRGTGRVTMGDRASSRPVGRAAPALPRDVPNRRPVPSPPASMPSGGQGGSGERDRSSPVSIAVGVQ
ncbi:MAG: hypothetical protein ACR2L6_11620 [Gemmatimonadaceae bacterium]